ncbi:ABC transporter ATP-binding protein [Sulfurovum mangrovi]|jgi:iron complex transport system ATP-binding protein|uniref:ABC transporter ATP-binding protein n=1 Tax=Sulfurovum mangrovi TaxID=2893889 RepID=UPI001E2AF4A5|nr:ATP-binding cassette domain-containing protein [Sulfurovum mangrovi]UFH60425.1 ATP-binding cassette domain-containing protein [Sulfurovum mangrovi]
MNIIHFKNITVGYDDKIILKDLDLTIKQGEHWAILGANGSGKSTLMKLIQSEIHPRFDKNSTKELFGKSRYSLFELRDKIGVISNDLHNFFSDKASYLSGYEVVQSGFYSSFSIFKYQDFTEEQHHKVSQTLEFLEIGHLKEKSVSSMSTGELRKCIIARALIHDPQAFILDEPTVGLDIKAQINFLKMLKKLARRSSIILVTHHLEEIFEDITKIALIYDNTIYKSGYKDEILTNENLSTIFETKLTISQKNHRYYVEAVDE